MTHGIDRIGSDTRIDTGYENSFKNYKKPSQVPFIDIGNLLNGKMSTPGAVQNSDNAFQAYNKDDTAIT